MKVDLQRLQKQSGIIGTSEKIYEVLGMIAQVAPVDISVLITGESGCGKEIILKFLEMIMPLLMARALEITFMLKI